MMNIIICGAGEVGRHAAEVLTAAGHNITIVDIDPRRLTEIEETLDVQTLAGNCANADVLQKAGSQDADALVAATNTDEINLLTAAVSKGVGVKKAIARVHHSAYFDHRGLDYQAHLGIDQLICPEYSTALAIASTLRNPGAIAIENFVRGQIEIQEFMVGEGAAAVGKTLMELALPQGLRLAAIRRGGDAFLPAADTVIQPGDGVLLAGNADVFPAGRKRFERHDPGRRSVVLMGGPAMGVWLCRALKDQPFSIRLFEIDRARAEELADKLDWITVINADPTDAAVFDEEGIAEADAFIALTNDDEQNILGCAWAKSMGVRQVLSVAQRRSYLHLVSRIGVDHAFSPRIVAARQIERELDDQSLRRLASLAEGIIDVYRVRVGGLGEVIGKPLKKVRLTPDFMILAIQHGPEVRVPGAEDFIHVNDTVLVVGRHGQERRLRKLFAAD